MMYNIKKYLLVLIILLFSISLFGQSNQRLYREFGEYTFNHQQYPNTYTKYRLYVTVENVSQYENKNSYVNHNYKYKIWGVSLSSYYGYHRNTYIDNFEIYWNDSNEPLNYHPINLYIHKRPTLLYEIKANDVQPLIYIKWSNSYLDQRQ